MAGAAADRPLFLFESIIRGHHIYKALWTPVVGETVQVCREPSNPYDIHAVAIVKDGTTIGHVPREIRRVFSSFLLQGGDISCEVNGHRKLGKGLEVPCIYQFTGKENIIKKARAKLCKKKSRSTR